MNYLKTIVLLTALTALFVWLGKMIGGQAGMIIAFTLALVMNGVSYWFSDKIVLRMYGAREVDMAQAPQLHEIVRQLAQAAGLPMPKLYVMENPMPNAFATGRDPQHAAVAVTTGLLGTLNYNEVRGVLAHELAHVKNRDILIGTIAASVAGAVMMLADFARVAAWFGGSSHDDEEGGSPIVLLLISLIAPVAALIIQMAVSRSREYEADATGAHISGDPRALASALLNLENGSPALATDVRPNTAHMFIVNPLNGGGLLSLFSTHPPIPERVRRLEAMAVAGVR